MTKRSDFYGKNLCPSRKQARFAPRAAKNKKGNWVFIINSIKTNEETEIIQTVDWEICQLDESHECNVDGFSFKSTCKGFLTFL